MIPMHAGGELQKQSAKTIQKEVPDSRSVCPVPRLELFTAKSHKTPLCQQMNQNELKKMGEALCFLLNVTQRRRRKQFWRRHTGSRICGECRGNVQPTANDTSCQKDGARGSTGTGFTHGLGFLVATP